ncbi:unnamed protein product, partial [marine sediment metagenome]
HYLLKREVNKKCGPVPGQARITESLTTRME